MIRLLLLTIGLFGLQIAWSVELAQGTPYLLQLGMSKSATSLVWLAGPLSGLIMQPLIGLWSDQHASSYGKRRPFMVAGMIVVCVSFVLIGWTHELATFISDEAWATYGVAVVAFYLLDFSINAIQASGRALIVDTCDAEEQSRGNVWASAMLNLGSVVGYLMGYLSLDWLPFHGNGHVKALCVLASVVLAASVTLTACTIQEASSVGTPQKSLQSHLTKLINTFRTLNERVQRVCYVQFFTSMGLFPFLFYVTSWLAELHQHEHPLATHVESVQHASLMFSVHAMVALVTSVLVPYLPFSMVHIYAVALCWFALLLASTVLVSSLTVAGIIVALAGMSWAVILWAPFTLIGEALRNHAMVYIPLQEGDDNFEEEGGMDVGLVLGIQNVYIVVPQFVMSLLSSILFAYFDISIVFLIGGGCFLIATVLAIQL
jgi:solute carrier family 45 protein 1/2/4